MFVEEVATAHNLKVVELETEPEVDSCTADELLHPVGVQLGVVERLKETECCAHR